LYPKFTYRLVWILIVCCCCSGWVSAQLPDTTRLYGNLRSRTLALLGDTLQIDSLSLSADGFRLTGADSSDYILLPQHAQLVWKRKPTRDSVQVQYRVLPFSFNREHYHKHPDLIRKNIAMRPYSYSLGDTAMKGFVQFNSIDYNGTYGRSLTIGNSQDLSLNSNFNLQLNGYVLDSVRIEAAITDNNIPIQPDGNTQQLQEFDQIYITFEKGRHKLTAGDYNLDRPNSYFINFTKRVQGLYYQGTFPAGKKVQNHIGLSGSIAKGQFARNILFGIEGNQGPYKLTGNNGEQFFIVLAGTEKVYIDGILMERGEDRDYVINYNTGEITFMPRQLITKDKRLQFEFEYQDRNYLNTLLFASDELKIGDKWSVRLNAYSNQDARNQPYVQTLSAEQKQFLSGIGDDIDQAFYKSITVDTFAANKILYKMVDTVVNGQTYDSVFVYSTHPDSARYSLGFAYVGEQKGNYIIAASNTNGRSYTWVAPEAGLRQGNYEPVVLLITPKKQQLFTLGTTYQIDSFKQVNIELGASNYAPNLFSDRDNHLHWGLSGRGQYEELRFLGNRDSLGRAAFRWKNQLSYEYVQSRFKAIAPYRNVEFARDWNIDPGIQAADEQLITYETNLEKRRWGSFRYNLTWYSRGVLYQAHRNIAALNYDHGNVRGNATFNLMLSEHPLQKSRYFRPSAYLEKTFPRWAGMTLGTRFEREQNELRYAPSDSLLPAAFAFDVLRFYIRNDGGQKTRVNINYTLRRDDVPVAGDLKTVNNGQTLDAELGFFQIKNQEISITGAYRKLQVNIPTVNGPQAGETILGRLRWEGNIRRNFLVPSFLYEAGSGQEQRRIYTYVEVPVGQGVYMWNDYNGDGVQQANEFELAIYPDQRRFIRLITPTNEYVKVNYVLLNAALQLNPESLWQEKTERKGWQKFTARFSDQLSVQVNNRVLAGQGMDAYNPFTSGISDSNIIANITSISNTLFFNRNSSVWGAEYTLGYNAGKSLLTYGLEGNGQTRHNAKARWAFSPSFTAQLQGQTGRRIYRSALDDGRSYEVVGHAAEPSLTWLLRSAFRVTGGYKWEERTNMIGAVGERALIQSLQLDFRASMRSIGTLQGRGTFAAIDYNAAANTSISFVMLDALQQGTNWLWYLNWERRLSKGIEISLEYEGRKPGDNPVIHTGRMSVRAVL